MGVACKLIGIGTLLVISYIGFQGYSLLTEVPKLPKLVGKYWGPGKPIKDDTSIKPFKINIPDEVITDLKDRLNKALPFQTPLEGVNQHYGMNTKLLTKVVDYWKTKYNWRDREVFLNQYPQFQTTVQGLKIHFIHAKPKNVPQGVEVLPLLLLHGWPGSVREFYEIIPLLTTPQKGQKFVFEVIAPSLPGYGFSEGASKTGLGPAEMAEIFNNLMLRLKFNNYYIQGGDWGAIIVHWLAALYPNNVIAVHSNMCFVSTPLANLKLMVGAYFPSLIVDELEKEKNYPLGGVFSNMLLEFGYMHLQATKPDTIGVALRDTPVGLAAYILEKFTTWTNPAWKDLEDGGLTKKFTMDQLLDNVMIYWVTRSITTSMRLYSECFNSKFLEYPMPPVGIPSGCARFKYELAYPPKSILKDQYRQLLQISDLEEGGHFAAFEVPNILAKDVFEFVNKVRKLANVSAKQEL